LVGNDISYVTFVDLDPDFLNYNYVKVIIHQELLEHIRHIDAYNVKGLKGHMFKANKCYDTANISNIKIVITETAYALLNALIPGDYVSSAY
jgi:hypothetical protein